MPASHLAQPNPQDTRPVRTVSIVAFACLAGAVFANPEPR